MAGQLAESRPGIRPAHPFLKWVGGKRQLLKAIRALIPKRVGTYFEPFVGGGAVFFDLQFPTSVLGDINPDLVESYQVVRDRAADLIEALERHAERHNKKHYYAVRSLEPQTLSAVERVARLVYLNRTCFNGLYRVNKQGQFNVPMGAYKKPRICDHANLLAAGEALRSAEVICAGFREICRNATSGDFVYFDPPYVPLSASSNFVSYVQDGFSLADQEELAALFRELSSRGVNCLLSNSSAPRVLELYRDFNIVFVEARRAVNSVGNGRGKVNEVLVTNY